MGDSPHLGESHSDSVLNFIQPNVKTGKEMILIQLIPISIPVANQKAPKRNEIQQVRLRHPPKGEKATSGTSQQKEHPNP